jgi:hypothetical protein
MRVVYLIGISRLDETYRDSRFAMEHEGSTELIKEQPGDCCVLHNEESARSLRGFYLVIMVKGKNHIKVRKI